MEPKDYWHFVDEFTVYEAAVLIAGGNPSDYSNSNFGDQGPPGYDAVLTALDRAIENKIIPFKLINAYGNQQQAIEKKELQRWLAGRAYKKGFFFEKDVATDDFLNVEHPNYAPKLAAAVTGWIAVTSDSARLSGKSPKQAIGKWLRENASQYELTKDDGKPNESAIKSICKIANWEPEGGAPTTPTQVQKNLSTPKNSGKSRKSVEMTTNNSNH